MRNRQLTLVSLIAILAAPRIEAQAIEYIQVARAAPGLSAPANGVLARPAQIVVRGLPLADALTLLSERARVPIAFSASLLPDRTYLVDCPCQTATIAEALDRMLGGRAGGGGAGGSNLDYLELHGQIVIFPRPAAAGEGGTRLAATAHWPEGNADWLKTRLTLAVPAPVRTPLLLGGVRGKVVEAGSGRPLSGVEVVIVGVGRSAVTSASGEYVLADVPDGSHRLRARVIGHAIREQTVTIEPGQEVSADFELAVVAIALDEVVVTGTAGPVSRRTLGNAITTIDAADALDKGVNTNVAELLQARAPGVTVLQSSGTPGTAGNIRIRGITSLAGTSEPVVYVDGVRIHSGAGGSFRNNWENTNQNQTAAGGGQTAWALDAINPEDIESIEVIKGPAAATLYGADAANGVIQIITKRGRAGDQKLQWHAKLQLGETSWGLDRRASQTTCDAVRLGLPAEWPGCVGKTTNSLITETFLDDAVVGGAMRNGSLSVSGGGRGYSFYAALDNDLEEGVFANSSNERTSTRANFSFLPSEKVDFAVNLAYSRSETAFPMGDNGPNVLEAAWTYQPGRAPQPGQTYGFNGGTPDQYAVYDNRLVGDRIVIGTTLTHRPFARFRHRLTVGGDINARQANRYIEPGGLFAPTGGQMTQGSSRNNIYTVDYAGTIEHRLPFGAGLPSALTFGLQYTNNQFFNTVAQGTGFSTPLVRDVRSATDRFSWDQQSAVKTLGLFAQEQVAWRERLYLTGAVRVDNSSVFGEEINQLFYPKVSVSYLISEESFLQDRYTWLDNLKLRLAWGQAGNAPDPFAKVTTYGFWQTIDPVTGATVSPLRLLTLGNPRVKPERGSEVEVGFDAALIDNRVGVEFTYYNKTTKDALMQVPLSKSATGIAGGSQLRNLGEINNRGVELSVFATPIRGRVVTWDGRLGFSTNRNRLVDFGFQQTPILLGVTTLNQQHVEGYPLAGYWVHDPVYDAGTATYIASAARYLGPSMPTREASLSNTVTFRGNLRLHTLLDYKGGHYLLNMTDWKRCTAGVCAEVNDPNVTPTRTAMLQADLKANDALYTQRADFIKVREVSLTYTLPPEWSSRFRADRVALSVAAHNLGYLWKPYYKGLDPEVTFNGVNQPAGDGQTFGWVRMDYWTVPMLRRLTVSVDVSF